MATRRNKSVLTEKQEKFVEGVLDGNAAITAALNAGYSPKTSTTTLLGASANVRHVLAEARAELSSTLQIKRADLIVLLMEAVDMARLLSDPVAMVTGVREIGKMLGLYAPEEKKIELSLNQARLRSVYESMGDEELLEIIEGESRHV